MFSGLLPSALTLGAGCAPVTTGAFTQPARLESDLERGVSTKRDVQRVLGTPKGSGRTVLPTDPREREIWYYEDIKVADYKKAADGYIHADVSQQVLLVMFLDGHLDGFMWFSGGGRTQPK